MSPREDRKVTLRFGTVLRGLMVPVLVAPLLMCGDASHAPSAAEPGDPDHDGQGEAEPTGTATSAYFAGGGADAFYRGCYSDDANRALPVLLSGGGSTIESCIAAAKSAGYAYAGVQYYGQCFAGNTLGYSKLAASSCNTPCNANTNENCGGSWANSVYQLVTPGATSWPGWESASTTAPSWLFGGAWGSSDCGTYGDGAGKYCNLPVPGSSTLTWNGQTATLVELRGWLTGGSANGDPDFGYDFELDPQYAAATLGMADLNAIFKVGNILNFQKDSQNLGTFSRAVATPLIHVELSGWQFANHPGEVHPPDWQNYGVALNVVWPFNPTQFAQGQYVRMVGSIVTDEPHCTAGGDLGDAIRKWARSGCSTNFSSANSARWTELHSPDLIQAIAEPANARDVTLKAVADVAENGLFSGETNTVDIDILPPQNQYVGGVCPYGVTVDERVGGETNYGTITDGNASRSGARIDYYPDHAHVHVTVQGQSGYGAPGKFKAIYKVACTTCTPSSCASQGRTCGSTTDGCGTALSCGSCASGQVCSSGTCTTPPPPFDCNACSCGCNTAGTACAAPRFCSSTCSRSGGFCDACLGCQF